MPPKGNKKKKKVHKRDRNEKATCCEGCAKQLDKHDFVYCECTQVKFCTDECQRQFPHQECPGPPERTVNMDEFAEAADDRDKWMSAGSVSKQNEELDETVTEPSCEYILSKGFRNLESLTAWDLAKWADEGDEIGNQACAFLAGSRFRHRMLSTPTYSEERRQEGQLVIHNKTEHNIPVLESEELAFTYFEKAAKLGHGLSMQSLATCFDEGVGCRENRRRCNDWLWCSCLSNSHGAIDMLDTKSLLRLEISIQCQNIANAVQHLEPGQDMSVGGPILASLLLMFIDTIKKEDFSLKPFAGTWATGAVNNPRTSTSLETTRVPIIGKEALKELIMLEDFLLSRGTLVQHQYGRRGTYKTATAMSYGAAPRMVDNQLFYAPPFAACDERYTMDEYRRWSQSIRDLYHSRRSQVLFPFCVHVEKDQDRIGKSPFCKECEEEAKERLEAVAIGSVVLSVDEEICQRGHAAIWKNPDGSIKMEGWKTYASGEAECLLAVIVASGLTQYAHPLFIAQDPNFFWPLIYKHGSIRAAQEFVAPHIDWNDKIGTTKPNFLEQKPIIPGCQPGQYLKKCGNNFCKNLERFKADGFQLCGGCGRRFYCSKECSTADWLVHKLECNKTSTSKKADPRVDISEDVPTEDLKFKYEMRLNEGDDSVVHGLQAKPQYNGKVCIVGKTNSNGRVAVTLRTDDKNVLSIKPENLYCIGVYCRTRRKKSRVFEFVHGLQVCAECYFDFSTVNRLAQFKYTGQDFTSSHAIEQVNDTYFSSFEVGDNEESYSPEKDWPLECIGMKHKKQRFILKALLDTKDEMSLHAQVAQTAFITFGAARYRALRASTRLEKVAHLL